MNRRVYTMHALRVMRARVQAALGRLDAACSPWCASRTDAARDVASAFHSLRDVPGLADYVSGRLDLSDIEIE